ncbi:MAG: M17 family peptidase N-terminal domain-containing protein, partial [Gemmatimonadales bacterium]
MRSSVKVVPLEQVGAQALAVIVGELVNRKVPASLLGLESATQGELSRLIDSGDFIGEADQVAVAYPKRGARRLILVGLGKHEEVTRGAVRRAAAIGTRKAV